MIFGTDTSKYQAPGTYDPGAFEIVNAEDHSMPTKVARNVTDDRPWGLYVWLYAGEGGASLVNRARAAIDRAGHGLPPLLVWWDYEDRGVAQWQLDEAFAKADAVGLPSGYYSNAGTLDHAALAARPWWLAAYPGMNDGTWPGTGAGRIADGEYQYAKGQWRSVQLWQFSSSNGNLDRNAVIDEAWYAGLAGGSDDMPLTQKDLETLSDFLFTDAPFGFTRFDVAVQKSQTLAKWLQDRDAHVDKALQTFTEQLDAKLAALPEGAAGGAGVSEQDVLDIINRTKLSAEPAQ